MTLVCKLNSNQLNSKLVGVSQLSFRSFCRNLLHSTSFTQHYQPLRQNNVNKQCHSLCILSWDNLQRLRNFSSSNASFKSYEKVDNLSTSYENEEDVVGAGTWQEVYKGVLTTQFKLLKMFSISTSIIGISFQPLLYEKLGTVNLGVFLGLASFVGVFTFATPALIHFVAKKYVTKLEYDVEADIYAATTLSFFLREKKIHFKAEDIVRPAVPGLFTSFLVKNRPLFVDPSMFEDQSHYARIMGFDKPLDISLQRDES